MRCTKILVLGLAAAVAASCSDQLPTEAGSELQAGQESLARGGVTAAANDLLSSIPVTGDLTGGGTFAGILSITSLALENGVLVASGTLTGVADQGGTVTDIVQTFTDVALGLTTSGTGAHCDVLNLDLGPLFLDLLGLQVDLSAISLDIVAQPGPGNLLGNLLCAVASLLDGPGALAAIGNLLDAINNLLG